MVTISKLGGVNGTSETEFCGLSSDIKPVDEGIPNGSSFFLRWIPSMYISLTKLQKHG